MEKIFSMIMGWIMTSQGIITLVVTAIIGFITKKFPREKLGAIVDGFAIVAGKFINLTRLPFLPKKLAVKIEEEILTTIFYLFKRFFEKIEDVIIADNAIEVKESSLPKKDAYELHKANKQKEKSSKIIKDIQERHSRGRHI